MSQLDLKSNSSVLFAAKHWRVPASLLFAIIQAEGGSAAFLTAIQCSVPTCGSFESALDIGCRTIVHAMGDYIQSEGHLRQNFLNLLASRWAPIGAENDPTNLNANWKHNVAQGWRASDPA